MNIDGVEVTEDELWDVLAQAEEYASQYLRDLNNYPPVSGGWMFFDAETQLYHRERNIPRQSDHLKDSWEVEFTLDGTNYEYNITNTKFVGRWNLLADILEVADGTPYTIPFGKKKMTFWSRYANQWNFNRQTRGGIPRGYTEAMLELIDDAAEYGIGEAVADLEE
jgi:hypothetical protein